MRLFKKVNPKSSYYSYCWAIGCMAIVKGINFTCKLFKLKRGKVTYWKQKVMAFPNYHPKTWGGYRYFTFFSLKTLLIFPFFSKFFYKIY